MYFQSDYILRMIEMGASFYRRLIEMLKGETPEQRESLAEKTIGGEMLSRIGLSLDAIRVMPADTLTAVLPDPGSRVLLMEYLFAAYELLENADDREHLAIKALSLLVSIPAESAAAEQLYMRGRTALATLGDAVNQRLHASMGAFFEQLGHYDAAENEYDFSGDNDALACFYRRMLLLDDEALHRGGITREEVEEAAKGMMI